VRQYQLVEGTKTYYRTGARARPLRTASTDLPAPTPAPYARNPVHRVLIGRGGSHTLRGTEGRDVSGPMAAAGGVAPAVTRATPAGAAAAANWPPRWLHGLARTVHTAAPAAADPLTAPAPASVPAPRQVVELARQLQLDAALEAYRAWRAHRYDSG
jgi:hypothetical protein